MRLFRPIALLLLTLTCGASVAPGQAPTPSARKPPARPAARDADVQVVPKDKETASPFLRPPGSDRYEGDWESVPPWRQASFFGIRARGQTFIYVVDCSESMTDDGRLVRAKAELRRSVLALQPPQRFKVIFYNNEPIPMPGDLPRSADLVAKDQLFQWLRLIEPDGGTEPRSSLGLAIALQPDAIFLLSDGEYPAGTAAAIARKNPRKVPIHCIDLGDGTSSGQLQQIARDSGGQFRWRPQVSPP